MLEGLCTNSFSRLRRQLEQDFTFFANAANETPGTDPRERNPAAVADQLDAQEARFLENFLKLLEAGHYKLLTAAEWDAACAEEFLLTLPVSVNYDAMDDTLLPRALWAAHPDAREGAPPEIVDRMLVFHRGVDVAHINGTFLMPKVDLLISFYILQPMFALFTWIMAKLGVKRFVPEAPTYVAPAEEADAAVTDATTKAEVKATAAAIKAGQLHEATVSIERRTFARAFPNGKSVFQQLLKKVDLREACFKDVIVLYRKSVPNGKVQRQEMDLIKDADPEFVKRNLVVKRFASIPISDLELVFPDKKIYLPPQMMVNLVVTIVGALVTVITTLSAVSAF